MLLGCQFSIDGKLQLPLGCRCRCRCVRVVVSLAEGARGRSFQIEPRCCALLQICRALALLLSPSTPSHSFIIHLQILLRSSIRIKVLFLGLFTFKVSLCGAIPSAHPFLTFLHTIRVPGRLLSYPAQQVKYHHLRPLSRGHFTSSFASAVFSVGKNQSS